MYAGAMRNAICAGQLTISSCMVLGVPLMPEEEGTEEEGVSLGSELGTELGASDGKEDGTSEGTVEGTEDGASEGVVEGNKVMTSAKEKCWFVFSQRLCYIVKFVFLVVVGPRGALAWLLCFGSASSAPLGRS